MQPLKNGNDIRAAESRNPWLTQNIDVITSDAASGEQFPKQNRTGSELWRPVAVILLYGSASGAWIRFPVWHSSITVCHSRYCIKTTKPILNFFDHLVAPSFKHLAPLTPIPNYKGNPFIGGV